MSTHFVVVVVVVSNLCLWCTRPMWIVAPHLSCTRQAQTLRYESLDFTADKALFINHLSGKLTHTSRVQRTQYGADTDELQQNDQSTWSSSSDGSNVLHSKNKTNLFILISSLALDFSSFIRNACEPVMVFTWDARDRARAHKSHECENGKNEKSKRTKKEMSYFRQFAVGILSWNEKYSALAANERCLLRLGVAAILVINLWLNLMA